MKKRDLLGIFLAGCVGISLLTAMILRTFLPRIILPRLDAIAVVTLCLAALVLDYYIAKQSRRVYWLIPIYGALIFGLFPYAASFTAPLDSLVLAALGAVIFTLVTFLFDSMTERLSSGPVARLAPPVSAIGLFLAAQCLAGII